MIAAHKGGQVSFIDGHLFVIKHLLVLSSQLTYFDIQVIILILKMFLFIICYVSLRAIKYQLCCYREASGFLSI